MRQLWTQVLLLAFLASVAHAQSPKQLWVLQAPDQIVEYDVATFTAKRTMQVPRRLLEQPEFLSVSGKGQMPFAPPLGMEWAGGEMAGARHRVRLWDGQRVSEWKLEGTQTRGRSAGKPVLVETAPRCLLSAGGQHLVWFENRFEKVLDDSGAERSV